MLTQRPSLLLHGCPLHHLTSIVVPSRDLSICQEIQEQVCSLPIGWCPTCGLQEVSGTADGSPQPVQCMLGTICCPRAVEDCLCEVAGNRLMTHLYLRICPRLAWLLTIDDLPISWVEKSHGHTMCSGWGLPDLPIPTCLRSSEV